MFVRRCVDSVVVLDDVELIPVLETRAIRVCHGRPAIPVWPSPRPAAGVASLLAGVPRRGRDHRVGPVQDGSWHVPTSGFTERALLRRVLEAMFQNLSE